MDESETAVPTPTNTPTLAPPTNKEQPGIFMEDICAGKINVFEIKMVVGGGRWEGGGV